MSVTERAVPATPLPETVERDEPVVDTPEEAILTFYESYLDYGSTYCCDPETYRSPLTDQIYWDSPYLADELKTAIDQRLEEMGPSGYDPLICAQNWPEWVQVRDVVIDGSVASAVVETSLLAEDNRYHAFPVTLGKADDIWQLTEIACLPEAQAEARADAPVVKEDDWQTYTDDSYGFGFDYPSSWVAQEAQIVGADAPVQKVVTFAPGDWTGPVAPLSVEIGSSQGDIEHTSSFEMDGFIIFVQEAPNGEVLYTLDWPGGIRLTVRDSSLLAAGGDEDLASGWQPFAEAFVAGIVASFNQR